MHFILVICFKKVNHFHFSRSEMAAKYAKIDREDFGRKFSTRFAFFFFFFYSIVIEHQSHDKLKSVK